MNKLIQVNSVSRLLISKNLSKQSVCGFKVISEQRNTNAKHSQKQKAVSFLKKSINLIKKLSHFLKKKSPPIIAL
jgi:hypothetical protein